MKRKQLGTLFIALIFGGSFLAYALSYSMPGQQSSLGRSRARILISACDEEKEIPEVDISRESFRFNSTSEGIIEFTGKDISLGKAFDLLNITFSEDQLMNYTNGDGCPDLPSNEVHVFVRSYDQDSFRESNQFRNYKIENGDIIQVRYY